MRAGGAIPGATGVGMGVAISGLRVPGIQPGTKNKTNKLVPTMIVKPSITFLTLDPDPDLAVRIQTIIESMTGNDAFPTPAPTLSAMTTALNDFRTALALAADGGRELTAEKNARRAVLVSLARQLASYVSVACKGEMPALLSSGFPIQKPSRTPAVVLPPPEAPVLSLGARSGELAAKTAPVPNGYTYNWRISLVSSPTHFIRTIQTTGARVVFTGLTPGQTYVVSVNVVGSKGPSSWSDSSQQMVI